MKFIGFIALVLLGTSAFCQQADYGKVWVNGDPVSYTSVFNAGQVSNQFLDTTFKVFFTNGHSNICDSTGNLLLLSDGYSIYNAALDTIEGGYKVVPDAWFNLNGQDQPFNQGSLFLPVGNGKYYFVNTIGSDSLLQEAQTNPNMGDLFDELLYDLVDMNANGGNGKVVKLMRTALKSATLSVTQMMACRHGDGKSWWLLKQARDTNLVYKFLFTRDSVYGPYIQGFSQPHFTVFCRGGQSVFSKDGTRYATVARGSLNVFVADFDRCSGTLSNPKTYVAPGLPIYYPDSNTLAGYETFIDGAAFSPNGRYLYINNYYHVLQLDLQDSNPNTQWYMVAGIDTTWNQFQEYASIHLGPDDKLYIGNWHAISAQMSVIDNPDNKGAACGFCPRCLRFPRFHFNPNNYGGSVTSPPNMPNYKLGAANPICWPVGVPHTSQPEAIFKLYPNPATASLNIEYNEAGQIELTDMLGRLVQTNVLPADKDKYSIAIDQLNPGIYTWRYLVDGQQALSGKLTIIR